MFRCFRCFDVLRKLLFGISGFAKSFKVVQEHDIPQHPNFPTKIQAVEAAPPTPHLHAVHQLPVLDAPPRHDDLDVREQVLEITRRQRRTRHDHDERFAQVPQAR